MQNKINFNKKPKAAPQNPQYDLFRSENFETENGFAKMLIQNRSAAIDSLVSNLDSSDHKLEHVATRNGIEIINDSHAINANRLWFSLDSVNKKITWITSLNTADDLSESLLELIKDKVTRIVALSVYDLDVLAQFENLGKQIILCDDMETAVRKAFYASNPGEAVLFSPGTKSEAQYASYKDRGNYFKEAVAQL